MSQKNHYQVVIVGGGTAGITVASQLQVQAPDLQVAIIEPSEKHFYQPIWTLVGGGVFTREISMRDEAQFIPPGHDWVQDRVTSFDPENNLVTTGNGDQISYDYLVVAAGIQIDWDGIKGLKDAIGQDGVCSNYSYDTVESTWQNIRTFKGGTALFTQPNTPIKCGGAPQKIMYLADDAFRRQGVREKSHVVFASAGASIFGVEKYAKSLHQVVQRKQIDLAFQRNLVELRASNKEAVFENLETGEQEVIDYDMIHVTPPMSAPDFIKSSPLSGEAGWVTVDKYSLQHDQFANVFALGDCSNLPTSKTGAAIRKQAPTLVSNLMSAMNGEPMVAEYHGYTSCPVVTGYGSLILAEFDYDGPAETFPFDQSQERYSMYALKAYGLPNLYWNGMLRGRV